MIFSRATGWIGVDIGCHVVKLAQVERRGRRYALTSAVAIARPAPWTEGELHRSAARSSRSELTAAFSLGDFAGVEAASNLSMAVCECLELPRELAVQAHAPRAVAESLDELHGWLPSGRIVDLWPVPAGADGAESHWTLSLSNDWASQTTADHAQSGLSCQVLDGLPLCLARAVRMMPGGERHAAPIAALDWGFGKVTFCLVARGVPQFVRPLPNCQLSGPLQTLQTEAGVSWDEAGALLTRRGLPSANRPADPLQLLTQAALTPALEQLAEEIERTLSYLRSYRRGLAPERFVLFGGGAAIANIESALEERLGASVQAWTLDEEEASAANAPLALFGPAAALSLLRCEEG